MAVKRMYTGGCHCGEVRYEVTTDLADVMSCNCSICTKLGALWMFTTPDQFALRTGEECLTEYRFNTRSVQHLSCTACGIESFVRGEMPDGTAVVGINVRCLDGVDIAALKPKPFDGKSR